MVTQYHSDPDHRAIDIRNFEGGSVYSLRDGVVSEVGSDPRSGNYLKVDHADNIQSSYSHTSSDVQVGQTVKEGEVIGRSDGSGSGPAHLHFVTRKNDVRVEPLQRDELPMKKLVFMTGALFVLTCMAVGQNTMAAGDKMEETAREFALRVKNLVLSGDREKFRQLPTFPHNQNNPDHRIFDDDIEHIFGYRSFFAKDNIQLKIYGPYTFANAKGLKDSNYIVIYYDPNQVQFGKKYVRPSFEFTEELWGRGFLETEIIKADNKWAFCYSVFYYGTDWPLTDEDYP